MFIISDAEALADTHINLYLHYSCKTSLMPVSYLVAAQGLLLHVGLLEDAATLTDKRLRQAVHELQRVELRAARHFQASAGQRFDRRSADSMTLLAAKTMVESLCQAVHEL